VSERNIILAGVGGQGILSIAYVVCHTALRRGMHLKQSEVHGMAQRGGAVVCHVRLSYEPIHADIVPTGMADIVLGVEPVEALRYQGYLSPRGAVVTSATPLRNISDYPELDGVLAQVAALPHHVLVDAKQLARMAGSTRAENMVMLGAAGARLGFEPGEYEPAIRALFSGKRVEVAEASLRAVALGRGAAAAYAQLCDEGLRGGQALARVGAMGEAELVECGEAAETAQHGG
jgi:indolepyruvate ferredoxin oxidoreductase beta subunit